MHPANESSPSVPTWMLMSFLISIFKHSLHLSNATQHYEPCVPGDEAREGQGKKEKETQSCTREVSYLNGLLLPERQGTDCLPLCVHWTMGAMGSARVPESWLQPHPELLSTIKVNSVWETTADLKCTPVNIIESCFIAYPGIRRSSITISHAVFKF